MENRVYPYRHVIGPPEPAAPVGNAPQVKYPLECGHTVTRPATAPAQRKARCESCPPTTMIGV